MAAALAPNPSVLHFDPRTCLPGRRSVKPKDTTVERCESLFDLSREEIGKTRSLNYLKDMHKLGADVWSMLDAIATTIDERLRSPIHTDHLPALAFLYDALTLFDLATREGPDRYDKDGHCIGNRDEVMDEYQRHFVTTLGSLVTFFDVNDKDPKKRKSVVSSLAGTSFKTGIFDVETTFLNCVSRILQVVGDPFRRALAEADCALSLMKAASPDSSFCSEVYRDHHFLAALEQYRLQAFGLVWVALGSESGKQFADQAAERFPFLPDMFFLWLTDESKDMRDVSFRCSCLLLDHLGEEWARSVMSLPDSMPMLLRAATDERADVRRFAFDMKERMLSLIGPFFVSKLEEADVIDSLLKAYLSDDTRSPQVELDIAKVLRAAEPDPAVLQKLSSKMSTTAIINRLVSEGSPRAVSILNSVIKGDTSGELARQLIVEGAISRCVDALTWKEKWDGGIHTKKFIERPPDLPEPTTRQKHQHIYNTYGWKTCDDPRTDGAIIENYEAGHSRDGRIVCENYTIDGIDYETRDYGPRTLERCGRTQLGVQANALLNTLFTFEPTQKAKAFLLFTQRDGVTVPTFNPNEPLAYSSLKAGFAAYKDVLGTLEDAFHSYRPGGKGAAHYPTLVAVADRLGLEGDPAQVLAQLGNHLEQYKLLVEKKGLKRTASPSELLDYDHRVKRLCGARLFLKMPGRGQVSNFRQLMQPPMLPPPPPALIMPPAAPSMLPPPAGPSSAPLVLMPPATPKATDAQIYDYLRLHILPRSDCAKCVVARTDESARLGYGTEARNQCPSLKRACCLAAHAFSIADGVALLDRFESENNVTVGDGGSSGRTIKREKIQEFMRSEHGVEPLGKAPTYKVTLYNAPQPGGGYTPASEHGSKGNYMGFEIV